MDKVKAFLTGIRARVKAAPATAVLLVLCLVAWLALSGVLIRWGNFETVTLVSLQEV